MTDISQITTIGLCQINAGFSGQFYLPYSAGVLEAYARQNLKRPDSFRFLLPVYKREPVEEAVEKLISADVVGLSLYVWNFQLSLSIARELKARKPSILVVVGGPHVPNPPDAKRPEPDLNEMFMRDYSFIDIACHGEGEKVFTYLLNHIEGDWSGVPSISYLLKDQIIHTPLAPRTEDLDSLPSPYLTGTFSRLMAANPHHKWIAVWETDRGCPFACSFCDWGSATGSKVHFVGMDRVFREIDWFGNHKIEFLFLANANFGIKARDIEIARYCAEMKARTGYPSRITASNTKNAQERSFEVQKIFAISGLHTGASVSMQSLDRGTLTAIKRNNIKLEGPRGFEELQRRFKEVGIQANTDIILCLPGETYDTFTNGINHLITNGQHDRILFYNLTILPNAEMGDPSYQKRYGLQTVTSGIINIHGKKSEDKWDVSETQQLVVATDTMSRADWERVRIFSWMTQFLYFDKLLQIPIVLAHELTGASYRELIELFSDDNFGSAKEFPTLTYIRCAFIMKAKDIQSGGAEFCHAEEWLDIWWPVDEHMLIDLATSDRLHNFYMEAEKALSYFARRRGFVKYVPVLEQAIRLNEQMLKWPFIRENCEVELSWNIWEYYQAAIRGKPIALAEIHSAMTIDRTSEQWGSWEDWYQEVVWWSSKRGAYLYNMSGASIELLAGHF